MTESQRIEKHKQEMQTLHKIFFSICCITILFKYYFTGKSLVVRITKPQFGLLGPYDTTDIKVEDDYQQLIDLKEFSFKINPQPCQEYPAGFLLMIIVSSNPNNYHNRMVIRDTWGQSTDSTKLVFLVGEPENSTLSQQIEYESSMYGDIVQGSFTDVYRNMTYKHVMGLKWVAHHCPMAKYVLKTDDDVVVNSNGLRQFLARELSPWSAKGLITCHVAEHAEVQRSHGSKWRVTSEEYAFPYYPDYCAGWAILYSRDVIPRLLKAVQHTPYFWIDDVHITGIVAQKIGVARTPLSSLVLTQSRVEVLRRLGPKYAGAFLLGPPDLKVDRMLQLWNAIPE